MIILPWVKNRKRPFNRNSKKGVGYDHDSPRREITIREKVISTAKITRGNVISSGPAYEDTLPRVMTRRQAAGTTPSNFLLPEKVF